MSLENRRPIRARSITVIQSLARSLARSSISPNQISGFSAVVSLLVPFAFFWDPQAGLYACLLAALGIQLRLLCNLLDGMVAIEGGKKSKVGDVYNEFPDRLSDTIILLGFGYCAWHSPHVASLAWAASLLALLTAYTRVLGASLGTKHFYGGPMAKQHRMALVTVALLFIPLARRMGIESAQVVTYTLWIIAVGCLVTVARRLRHISRELNAR